MNNSRDDEVVALTTERNLIEIGVVKPSGLITIEVATETVLQRI
jgi:hypothetical protein